MTLLKVKLNKIQMAHVEAVSEAAGVEVGDVIRKLIELDMDGSVTNDTSNTMSVSRMADRELLLSTLKKCEGNISETARELGEHRRTIQRKLIRYGIAASEYR